MNVDLLVRGDLTQQLQALYAESSSEFAFIFLIDPKRHGRADNYRAMPAADKIMLGQVAAALFNKDKPKFREDSDMLICFDGRSVNTNSQITKLLLKPGIECKFLPARGAAVLRVMHHHREFSVNGWVRQRSCGGLCPNLPDPLESVFVAAGSTRFKNLPRRERRWVDLPGDNASRGWTGVGLRTQEDLDLNSVLPQTKDLLFQGQPSTTESHTSECPEDESERVRVSCFPWEHSESIFKELHNCLAAETSQAKTLIVDLTPGSGVAATAAARHGVKYLAYCHNALHIDLIRETAPGSAAHTSNYSNLFQASCSRCHY